MMLNVLIVLDVFMVFDFLVFDFLMTLDVLMLVVCLRRHESRRLRGRISKKKGLACYEQKGCQAFILSTSTYRDNDLSSCLLLAWACILNANKVGEYRMNG